MMIQAQRSEKKMVSAIMVAVLRKSDELWSVEGWDIVSTSMVDICEGL